MSHAKPTIYRLRPDDPDPAVISRAADALRAGQLVAFPTETVYGLGAAALDAAAVSRIFSAKGRPAVNPIIVHVADAAAARELAADWPETAQRLADAFWPGPLTIVVKRRAIVPNIVTAGGPTVGIRVPGHPVALALLRAAAIPIAAPSANRSSRLSPTAAEHVLAGLSGRIDVLLDAGPCPGGLESSVVDLSSNTPRLLRPGLITAEQISAIIGPLATTSRDTDTAPLPSPGLLDRHYAPRAILECADDDGAARVNALRAEGRRIGWLRLGVVDDASADPLTLTLPPDPAAYSAGLYAALHALDAAAPERIIAALPPDTPEWLAVRDRLRRASQP